MEHRDESWRIVISGGGQRPVVDDSDKDQWWRIVISDGGQVPVE